MATIGTVGECQSIEVSIDGILQEIRQSILKNPNVIVKVVQCPSGEILQQFNVACCIYSHSLRQPTQPTQLNSLSSAVEYLQNQLSSISSTDDDHTTIHHHRHQSTSDIVSTASDHANINTQPLHEGQHRESKEVSDDDDDDDEHSIANGSEHYVSKQCNSSSSCSVLSAASNDLNIDDQSVVDENEANMCDMVQNMVIIPPRRSTRAKKLAQCQSNPLTTCSAKYTKRKRSSPSTIRQQVVSPERLDAETDKEEQESDEEATYSPPCQPSRQRKSIKKGGKPNPTEDDTVSTQQIEYLVVRLQTAYEDRHYIDVDHITKQQLRELGRDVLIPSTTDQSHQLDIILRLNNITNTSQSLKMLGYYFRSIIANDLKQHYPRQYKEQAKVKLRMKSTADIAAYPAFYDFVHQHYSNVVQKNDIDELLQLPIFLADISWSDWKKYLAKGGKSILDAAMIKFKQLEACKGPQRASPVGGPFQDWMELQWVELYDDRFGQGIRATRSIPMKSKVSDNVVVDMKTVGLMCSIEQLHQPSEYCFAINTRYYVNALNHWVGKINHCPIPHSNLRFTAGGQLVQIKDIVFGDSLTFDYGVEYWVFRITGKPMEYFLTSGVSAAVKRGRRELFYRMHRCVQDYTVLINMGLYQLMNEESISELQTEQMLVSIGEYVDALVQSAVV